MPCRCSKEGYDKFLAALFEECQYTNFQRAGAFFGWVSITFWIFAQYPQIRTQFCMKKAEAIPPLFMIQWLLGDILNIISVFLLRLHISQMAIAVYYIFCDVIMLFQIVYYNKCKTNIKPINTKIYFMWEGFFYLLLFIAVIGMCLVYGIGVMPFMEYVKQCPDDPVIPKAQSIAGDVTGYLTIPFYVSTRPIQVYHNCKRKKTENLNIIMFMFTFSANLTYFVGIFLRNSEPISEIIPQLPFVLNSFLPMIFDIVILCQYYYYKNKENAQKKGKDNIPNAQTILLESTQNEFTQNETIAAQNIS